MNQFQEILLLPGAAPVLAAKLSGRIIGRMANGFADDPALGPMMSLFKCIEAKWPNETMSLREMFNLQLQNAEKASPELHDTLEDLTPEQRATWEQGRATRDPKQRLLDILPTLLDLYHDTEADPDNWDDLTTINQWSLLNATENGLHTRRTRYEGWAATDREKGRTESRSIQLFEDAEEAIEPLFELITDFLEDPDIAKQLQEDRDRGIRVPTRAVA